MPEGEALAKRVKHERMQRNETQSEFAAGCGLSEDLISNIENCRANPRLDTLQSIGAYVGCTVAELIRVDYNDIS